MEKESYPQESAPPYPGPPMDYGQPPMYAPPSFPTPPGFPTQPGYPAVPAGHHGGIAFGKRIPPTGICTTKPWPSNGPGFGVTPMVVSTVLSDVPGQTLCPHCQQTVTTRTRRTAGLFAWAVCAGLCLLG
ncbi:PREDICTED: cell death-inducing p53-target protein 1-like [Poecilia mexicana]|uniref:cell death-inducing p53-target protein 1-like n=1 Tax=Poecilia mexicana TaxID=48701 RepID=UPI00072E6E35|nr:PREDICTED: cell death-inducing p53-target protein 1-like [Poecilia mexicana]